ncbi:MULTISPECIES: hypothetical protein [unclassified Pseudoxanthomonas]|nr:MULTISPECIES: hypothetical protein [unclassified Pseudoxanthomonas]
MPLLDDTDRIAEIVDVIDQQRAGTFGRIANKDAGPLGRYADSL